LNRQDAKGMVRIRGAGGARAKPEAGMALKAAHRISSCGPVVRIGGPADGHLTSGDVMGRPPNPDPAKPETKVLPEIIVRSGPWAGSGMAGRVLRPGKMVRYGWPSGRST
jgi:hypothetical protein